MLEDHKALSTFSEVVRGYIAYATKKSERTSNYYIAVRDDNVKGLSVK